MEQTNTRGGARPGAGRKPKAMQYAPVLNAVEAYFASELMNIAVEMVKRAKENNDNIAKYIMNRMFGVPARLADSPATDRILPYNDANLENAVNNLIQRSEGNSTLQQVIAEIYQDTICMPQPIAEKPMQHGCEDVQTRLEMQHGCEDVQTRLEIQHGCEDVQTRLEIQHECEDAQAQPFVTVAGPSDNTSCLSHIWQNGNATNSTKGFGEEGTSFLWGREITPELRSAAIAELRKKLNTEPDHNR